MDVFKTHTYTMCIFFISVFNLTSLDKRVINSDNRTAQPLLQDGMAYMYIVKQNKKKRLTETTTRGLQTAKAKRPWPQTQNHFKRQHSVNTVQKAFCDRGPLNNNPKSW